MINNAVKQPRNRKVNLNCSRSTNYRKSLTNNNAILIENTGDFISDITGIKTKNPSYSKCLSKPNDNITYLGSLSKEKLIQFCTQKGLCQQRKLTNISCMFLHFMQILMQKSFNISVLLVLRQTIDNYIVINNDICTLFAISTNKYSSLKGAICILHKKST